MHHEWTMHALAAGKHVLCEKPYTRHPHEAEEAFDVADAAGLVLAEAFMYRHHPQTATVARLVVDGAIGRLCAVKATFTFPLRDLSDVRALPELDGGALMDVGCYCVSGIRLLAGEPEHVRGEQVTGTTGIDMAFHGTLRCADGRRRPVRGGVPLARSASPSRRSARTACSSSRLRGGSTGAAA